MVLRGASFTAVRCPTYCPMMLSSWYARVEGERSSSSSTTTCCAHDDSPLQGDAGQWVCGLRSAHCSSCLDRHSVLDRLAGRRLPLDLSPSGQLLSVERGRQADAARLQGPEDCLVSEDMQPQPSPSRFSPWSGARNGRAVSGSNEDTGHGVDTHPSKVLCGPHGLGGVLVSTGPHVQYCFPKRHVVFGSTCSAVLLRLDFCSGVLELKPSVTTDEANGAGPVRLITGGLRGCVPARDPPIPKHLFAV